MPPRVDVGFARMGGSSEDVHKLAAELADARATASARREAKSALRVLKALS